MTYACSTLVDHLRPRLIARCYTYLGPVQTVSYGDQLVQDTVSYDDELLSFLHEVACRGELLEWSNMMQIRRRQRSLHPTALCCCELLQLMQKLYNIILLHIVLGLQPRCGCQILLPCKDSLASCSGIVVLWVSESASLPHKTHASDPKYVRITEVSLFHCCTMLFPRILGVQLCSWLSTLGPFWVLKLYLSTCMHQSINICDAQLASYVMRISPSTYVMLQTRVEAADGRECPDVKYKSARQCTFRAVIVRLLEM
jgi:hypothetical protein